MSFRKIVLFILVYFQTQFVFSQNPKNSNSEGGSLTPSNGPNSSQINPDKEYAINLINDIEANSSFISKLSSVDSALILPKGISKKIGGIRYSIGIDSMKFKADGAYLSAFAVLKFPGASGNDASRSIAFGAKNIKFNPEGVIGGDQARLQLLSDHTITINPNVKLVLLGSESKNWVSWNCGGFEKVHLKGYFVLNNTKFIPAPELTNANDVTATFETEFANLHEFIVQVSVTPFKIEGLEDFSFEVTKATVDYSELANASNMSFPPNYQNPNLYEEDDGPSTKGENNNSFDNGSVNQGTYKPQLWTGFYLESLKIYLPPQLNKNGSRTNIVASNILIDHMGLTGNIEANNIFTTGEGDMSGWGFSLDQIGLNFVCNNFVSGNLNGKVMLPIDEVKSLDYAAAVYKPQNANNLNYLFTINPTNNINLSVFGATVNINNNSAINVAVINNKFKPTAILNGYVGFDIPKLDSQNGQ